MSSNLSRRQLLVRSAATAASLTLASSLTMARKRARARVNPTPNPSADNEVLNALLAAEYDAIATYTAGAGIVAGDMGTPQATRDIVTQVAVHFQDQHKQHAAALKKMIEDNAGTPVADSAMATIPSSFPSAATTTDVIKLAADKEKQAAFTYAQVMENISTQNAAKLVASIGAVETQHFVVLYLLAEGLVSATPKAGEMPGLVVPAAFILDVGGTGTVNLENFPALDDLLKLDPKPAP